MPAHCQLVANMEPKSDATTQLFSAALALMAATGGEPKPARLPVEFVI